MKFKLLTEELSYKQSILNDASSISEALNDFILELADVENLTDFIQEADLTILSDAVKIINDFRDVYDVYATRIARDKARKNR